MRIVDTTSNNNYLFHLNNTCRIYKCLVSGKVIESISTQSYIYVNDYLYNLFCLYKFDKFFSDLGCVTLMLLCKSTSIGVTSL